MSQTSQSPAARPWLRLVKSTDLPARPALSLAETPNAHEDTRVDVEHPPHVLIVGDDAARRSKMLSELRGLLPSGTPFVEASETWDVLAQTTGSRMVVLTDGLGEVSTHTLMRILSRRHPTLPVIAVGSRTRSAEPPRVGVALV